MIAASIGRVFLKTYNEKSGQNLSAKDFFEDIFIKIFYDHPKYLMPGGNSPLENPKISWKKGETPSKENRKIRIAKLFEKIESGNSDASVSLEYPADNTNKFATTSGLVTDMNIDLLIEDKYFSWIGIGLGVGVSGALSIYFKNKEILMRIFEGWKIYRNYLNDSTLNNLRGNQINTWNGQWLSYVYNRYYHDDFDFAYLFQRGIFSKKEDFIEVNTIKWSELFFNLSRTFSNQDVLSYVYSLGQTNQTIGFFPLHFKEAKYLIEYYKFLFGENAAIQDAKTYESLFGFYGLSIACKFGSIGLQALEPKNLREYFGNDKNINFEKSNLKRKNKETDQEYKIRLEFQDKNEYENVVTFRTYKTWLSAMITKNKEEMIDYTKIVANELLKYRKGAYKNDRMNLIQSDLLSTNSKKQFIDTLVNIIKDVDGTSLDVFKDLRDQVHLMTSEEFGYFVVLLKFDYAYYDRKDLSTNQGI